jgi:hypothetical protein
MGEHNDRPVRVVLNEVKDLALGPADIDPSASPQDDGPPISENDRTNTLWLNA